MMQITMEVLWFFLPAMVANMAPVIFAKYRLWESLNQPIDRGTQFNNRAILGSHKTIRGFAVGILFGMLTGFIQYLLYVFERVQMISIADYSSVFFALFLGFLLGLGALTGDAVKSFLKRQLNIMPGKSWPIFDQIDFVLGALLVTFFLVELTLVHSIAAIFIIGIASFVVSVFGVAIRVKNNV